MHARDLVELAALLATHGRLLSASERALPTAGLEQYWTASKCRFDRWGRALTVHSARARDSDGDCRPLWPVLRPVLEEILVSEVLTRVWGSLCCGAERQGARGEAAPVVRNVFSGQLEASSRALQLMVDAHGMRVEDAVGLNRLRRRNERWTDLLLGLCRDYCDIGEFAFSAVRVRELAAPVAYTREGKLTQAMLVASLRITYRDSMAHETANADLNGQIAAGILNCLGKDRFDSTGRLLSPWIARLYHRGAEDREGEVEQLLRSDTTTTGIETRTQFRRGDQLGRF